LVIQSSNHFSPIVVLQRHRAKSESNDGIFPCRIKGLSPCQIFLQGIPSRLERKAFPLLS
jgi:hypothetical protein